MTERTISVRLDEGAQRALARLTKPGVSQSQAIRQALIDTARTAWFEQAQADAKRIGNDPADRAAIAEIHAFLDELAPPG